MSKPRSVCLVGFMAAGKTTIGKSLAEELRWKFIDLDKVIEELERATVAEIFQRSGQAAFRNSETAALEHTLKTQGSPFVLAVGGGAFARRENQELLRKADVLTIHLRAEIDELWNRANTSGAPERPMLRDREGFDALFHSRLPHFQTAEWEFSTGGKSVKQTTSELKRRLTSEGLA
jgi:shikimate kinase